MGIKTVSNNKKKNTKKRLLTWSSIKIRVKNKDRERDLVTKRSCKDREKKGRNVVREMKRKLKNRVRMTRSENLTHFQFTHHSVIKVSLKNFPSFAP